VTNFLLETGISPGLAGRIPSVDVEMTERWAARETTTGNTDRPFPAAAEVNV